MKKLCTCGDLVNNDINLTRVYPALKWLVTSEGDKTGNSNGLHGTTGQWDHNEVEHVTVRLSNPTLRAANSWYTLHWRLGGGSVVLQQPDNETSNIVRRERAKAKKQRKREREQARKEQQKKDEDRKDKDGNAGGTPVSTRSGRVK